MLKKKNYILIIASAIVMLHVNLLLTITKSFLPLSCPNYIYHQTKSVKETIMHHRSGIGFHSFTRSIAITNHITIWRFVGFSRSIAKSIVLILFSTRNMFLMISAYDLIAMYLTIELKSLQKVVVRKKWWEWGESIKNEGSGVTKKKKDAQKGVGVITHSGWKNY